tara:strand:- start:163 stop:495 length:333 start_codon:yes stop_codon:yes gene_type:complete
MSNELVTKKCVPCEGGVPPLDKSQIKRYHKLTPEWVVSQDQKTISRVFNFKGYYKTIAFVNAIAWIANKEGHHPDLEVSYNKCTVNFTTHAINGLTDNDFICAAKIDELV